MTRIAILDDYQGVARRYADWDSLGDVEVFGDHVDDIDILADRLTGFEVVILMRERTPFPRGVIERLGDLRLLVTTGPRNAAIDVAAATDHGVTVCGTESLTSPTVELTWGLILALARHILAEDRAVRDGGWQSTIGLGLEGRTLGVLGLGKIGSRVARVGQALGMETIAWSQNLTADRAGEIGVTAVGKDELFTRSDVLTIHLRLSDRTRGLVGAAEIAKMPSTALLINASRAEIVDVDALASALRDGRIGGAGLDVHPREPLPADDPLRALPRTVLTPHLGYVTDQNYELFFTQARENVEAWLAGTPVRVITGG